MSTLKARLKQVEKHISNGPKVIGVVWPDTPGMVTVDGRPMSRADFERQYPAGVVLVVRYGDTPAGE